MSAAVTLQKPPFLTRSLDQSHQPFGALRRETMPPKTPPFSRVGDYKLVKFWREDKKLLLFNLKDDFEETKDLAAAMPKKTEELHKQLMDYLESVDSDVLTLYS
jgi:hypothetical protein